MTITIAANPHAHFSSDFLIKTSSLRELKIFLSFILNNGLPETTPFPLTHPLPWNRAGTHAGHFHLQGV
ncbi:hypothetical protein [Paludibaculum fermentans]|uniref:Uncharacterized protein n=1 Tax=Paludibaculum fermentans TaxID=1473598 RepID=A0A7S7NRR0_PALFE|nr:hypothetical protein [Paludibaculum fermentans]QOY88500.1 hypothetical protein IRI77_00610 [Paludibaculum fermentans]